MPPKGYRWPVEERFWSKVEKTDGCWLWTACVDQAGYGKFGEGGQGGRTLRAPRVSYEWAYGPIPDGLYVLHRCDTPACVRPDHLFLGNAKDNALDVAKKGRARAQKITHCAQGHEFSDENTYYSGPRRRRACKTCSRAYYQRKKAACA